MVEAIFRRLSQTTELSPAEESHISPETAMGMKNHAILSAASDVSRSIFFAAAIIIAAFLPLFTLSGVEGNIFGPMARTYAYALAGGLLATFTVTPALSAIILPVHIRETETWIVKKLDRIYVPVLKWAIGNRKLVMAGAAGLVVLTIVFAPAARPRIPAQAGRGQPLDPRHVAADHLAAGRQYLRQRNPQGDPRAARG